MTTPTRPPALKLLPCPFCGGHAEHDSTSSFREFVSGKISRQVTIYCESCTASITVCVPDVPDITIEQVADMWNQRTESRDDLEATIEQLRSELAGEKAAALNYRADAISAGKMLDDAQEIAEQVTAAAELLKTQRDELLEGLNRIASLSNKHPKDPIACANEAKIIADASIASVKGGAA